MKKFFLFVVLLMLPTFAKGESFNENEKLIVFHLDMNSVALRMDYMKKWLAEISEMGYNAVLWELEDKVEWETCPECVSEDAMTKQEFKQLLQYSKGLGLQPIPLFQTIGHAEYVLKHEKHIPFREDPARYDCYFVCNPDVRKFIKNWINEYLELFGDIKYFHIGGDEAYVFGTNPACSEKVEEIGKVGLYAEYIQDIASVLIEKNIRPGIWNDMIMQDTERVNLIPKDFVIWDWNYWDGDEESESVMLWEKQSRIKKEDVNNELLKRIPEILNEDGSLNAFYVSDFFANKGYDVILSSSARSHGDAVFTINNNVHSTNIIGAARKTVQSNLLGNCVTSWAVRVPNYEIQAPWLMMAPFTINHPELSEDEIMSKVSEELFGVKGLDFYEAVSIVGSPFTFVDKKSTGIMWTGMKDMMPAPETYIKDFIEQQKSRGAWDKDISLIEKYIMETPEGIKKLYNFMHSSKKGYEILDAWMQGGYFQQWQLKIAEQIIKNEEGTAPDFDETIEIINSMKKEYYDWASTWMTPGYAEQTTRLIYDAILNYFIQQNK